MKTTDRVAVSELYLPQYGEGGESLVKLGMTKWETMLILCKILCPESFNTVKIKLMIVARSSDKYWMIILCWQHYLRLGGRLKTIGL